MKRPIEWHKETLKVMNFQVEKLRYEWVKMKYWIESDIKRLLFREKQIQEAEKRGLTEFDADKLLVKRSKP